MDQLSEQLQKCRSLMKQRYYKVITVSTCFSWLGVIQRILDPVSRKVTSICASPIAICSDFHNPERHSQYLQQTPTSILYTFLLSSTSGLLLTMHGFTGNTHLAKLNTQC